MALTLEGMIRFGELFRNGARAEETQSRDGKHFAFLAQLDSY